MPTVLDIPAVDRGTLVLTASFFDETDVATTPAAVTWTLLNRRNQVVNGREAVTLTPDDNVTIVLTGADLALTDGAYRTLLVEATYNSTNGTGLSLRDAVAFRVVNPIESSQSP